MTMRAVAVLVSVLVSEVVVLGVGVEVLSVGVEVEASSKEFLTKTFEGATTVISAIGGDGLVAATKVIIEAVAESKVKNLIVTGGAGALPAYTGSGKEFNWEVLAPRVGEWVKTISLVHIENWRALQATTGINWMFLCPGRMDHGPLTQPRVTIEEPAGPQISFEDVAAFMIANADVGHTEYNKKRVGMTTLL